MVRLNPELQRLVCRADAFIVPMTPETIGAVIAIGTTGSQTITTLRTK